VTARRASPGGRGRARKRRGPPRAELVRRAILGDLAASPLAAHVGLPLAELTTARAIARDVRELYIVAERLRATGALERAGEGYHRGDPHRYRLTTNAPEEGQE
jgi:hypothetical protein